MLIRGKKLLFTALLNCNAVNKQEYVQQICGTVFACYISGENIDIGAIFVF